MNVIPTHAGVDIRYQAVRPPLYHASSPSPPSSFAPVNEPSLPATNAALSFDRTVDLFASLAVTAAITAAGATTAMTGCGAVWAAAVTGYLKLIDVNGGERTMSARYRLFRDVGDPALTSPTYPARPGRPLLPAIDLFRPVGECEGDFELMSGSADSLPILISRCALEGVRRCVLSV